MSYEIRVDKEAAEFLNSQDPKTQRIIKNNLRKLEEHPYPSPEAEAGDREQVTLNGREVYRIHISRSYTAFYTVKDGQEEVIVTTIMDIDNAHKMYD